MVARETLALDDYDFLASQILEFLKFELPPHFHRLAKACEHRLICACFRPTAIKHDGFNHTQIIWFGNSWIF
jgi:hypothetical protein